MEKTLEPVAKAKDAFADAVDKAIDAIGEPPGESSLAKDSREELNEIAYKAAIEIVGAAQAGQPIPKLPNGADASEIVLSMYKKYFKPKTKQ